MGLISPRRHHRRETLGHILDGYIGTTWVRPWAQKLIAVLASHSVIVRD